MQSSFSKIQLSSKKMLTAFAIFIVSIAFLLSSAVGVLLVISGDQPSAYANVTRPTEPTNCTSSTTPTFNGYPTNMDNPNIDPTLCQDIPLLSFHPVAQTNPRVRNIQGQTSFQLTYINSATIGNNALAIQNPNVKIQVTKVNETQYKMSSQLSATNAPTYSSASEGANGGDLTINVPSGYKLKYVQRSSRHFDNNLVRDYESKYGDGQSPFDYINDNGANSNPIFSSFAGATLGSTAGFNFGTANKLNSGYLAGGYVLFTLDIEPVISNLPPAIPGQEITIIRGQSGSFTPLNPTDPDNDNPIALTVANALSYCTPPSVATGTIINCNAVANAPKRATFTITPKDARGLSGAPATFIVNILDPGLGVIKSCVKKDTQTPCADANLKPNDKVTYKLNLTNTGETDLTNVVMIDDYDQVKLTDVTNINPPASSTDLQNGTITWNIGNLAKNQSILGTFDATVKPTIADNTTILNKVSASANGVPTVTSEVTFPVVVPNTPPTIPGQEITIIRGQNGSFAGLNPTDPENNTPIALAISNALSNCTPSTSLVAGTVINCTTNATTPKRSTFTITPTDSKGLVGTPGTFIVNVIDPGLIISKECYTNSSKATKCANASIYPGDSVFYEITVRNSGDVNLTNVVVTDDYNENLVSKPTNIVPAQSGLNETTGVITWNLGTMAKDSAPIVLTYNSTVKSTITDIVNIKNVATADSDQTPPSTVEREFPVKKNLPPVIPGEEIIIIRGKDGSFKPLNPTDPENNTPITLAPNVVPPFCTPNTNLQASTVINCKTDSTTPKVSTFTITPTDSKGLVGTPGTFVVRIIDPGLNLIKKCFQTGTQKPCASLKSGDKVTYVLTIINNGETPLTGVTVTDDYDQTLLENITALNPNNGVNDNNKIVWTVGDLARGGSKEFAFTATIKSGSENKEIVNLAIADSNETDPARDDNKFNVIGEPKLLITKNCIALKNGTECKKAELTNGDEVKYTLVVKNSGNGKAENVKVVDDYDEVRISTISNVVPNGTVNSGLISWSLGTIEAGQSKELNYNGKITTGLANNTIINNIATASGDNVPPVSANYNFPIKVIPPVLVLGRTGGIAILASWGTIITAAGVFFYFSKVKKFAKTFVPQRTREDK